MKILQVLTMLSLVLGLAQMANAADTASMKKMQAEHGMQNADANKDGVISREEFMGAHKMRVEKMFDKMDANHDGKIDQAEHQAGKDKMMGRCEMKDHKMYEMEGKVNPK